MPRDGATGDSPPDPRLDDRVVEILTAHAGRIAFNGLRRTLRAHPESLARALRRLERSGLVSRREDGYALIADAALPSRARAAPFVDPRSVASVALPPGIQDAEVLGALAGRWFGSLRWVGIYERPDDPYLVWSVGESRGHVLLSVRRGTLRVLVDQPRESPEGPRLEEAAHELLIQGLTRLRRSDRGSSPSTVLLAGAPSVRLPLEN